MGKLKYFPFGESFDLRMGTSVFTDKDTLVEVDELHYLHEVKAKRVLLQKDHRYYYRSNDNTLPAQWDVVDKVLHSLATANPANFILQKERNQWHWQNKKLQEECTFTFGDEQSFSCEPLDWVGRQVQEDLVILSDDESASLVAGQLCFANGWSLDDKFNQPFLAIHAPAPAMIGPTMVSAQKLMEKILDKKPVWRCSWNFKVSGELDLSSQHNLRYNQFLKEVAPTLTTDNIGAQLYLRLERQTVSRLPRSNHILFGIHLYQYTLDEACLDKTQATQMLNVLKTTPPEMMMYKAITPFEKPLCEYLENIIRQ